MGGHKAENHSLSRIAGELVIISAKYNIFEKKIDG